MKRGGISKKLLTLGALGLISCGLFFYVTGCASVDNKIIKGSWNYYKKTFMSQDGRIIDYERNAVTTSEGQSYAMLRAVFIGDKEAFDKAYKWSVDNLGRKEDSLFAWLWGKREDNTWGIIDRNSASDADIDIAFALLLAGEHWSNNKYIYDAVTIIKDIWNLETKVINNQRVLMPGIVQAQNDIIPINPSYFAPYAFKVFAKYDKDHDWNSLVDSSYNLLTQSSALTESGLPPNWFNIDSKNGNTYIDKEKQDSDFSYDAIRVFLRVYVDYLIFNDKRAINILEKSKFFKDKYFNTYRQVKFFTNFKQSGEIRDKVENIGAIALLVPVFKTLYDKKKAHKIYKQKVISNYNPKGYWDGSKNYYTQNLAWFGTWMYIYEKETRKYFNQLIK